MQLKKISVEHYVVVGDSEIKMDDWYLDDTNTIRQAITECESYWTHRKNYKKITHSTPYKEWDYPNWVWDKIIPLDLSDVKSLVGEVNVRGIAEEKYPYEVGFGVNDENIRMGELQDAYMEGYNQCLEDNKDKKFSEEDMRKALSESFKASQEGYQITSDEIISSLTQPKDTWEVEFDSDNNLKIK